MLMSVDKVVHDCDMFVSKDCFIVIYEWNTLCKLFSELKQKVKVTNSWTLDSNMATLVRQYGLIKLCVSTMYNVI